MEVMGCQVQAISKAIRSLFTDPVTFSSQWPVVIRGCKSEFNMVGMDSSGACIGSLPEKLTNKQIHLFSDNQNLVRIVQYGSR